MAKETKSIYKFPKKKVDNNLERGVNYILAIAIDKYRHMRPLNNCVRDADDIVELLTEKYTFEPENVRKLYDKNATAEAILIALDEYVGKIKEVDSLVILYSGHGENRNDIGFWVPVDAERPTQYLPQSTIRDYLEPIKARHVFLICDSCFAGRFFATNTRNAGKSQPAEKFPSRYALTSGRSELVSDGNAGGNSPFAETLKNLLKNTNGPIGAVSLSESTMQDVANKVDQFQTPDHGILNVGYFQSRGQFYFHPKHDVAPEPSAHSIAVNVPQISIKEIYDWFGENTIAAKQTVDNMIKRYFPGDAPYPVSEFEGIIETLKEGPLKDRMIGS